jgi:hypothetical protein
MSSQLPLTALFILLSFDLITDTHSTNVLLRREQTAARHIAAASPSSSSSSSPSPLLPPAECHFSPPPWTLDSYTHLLPSYKSLSIHNASLWPRFLSHLRQLDKRSLWQHTPAYSLPSRLTDILDFVLHSEIRSKHDSANNSATINIAMIGGSYARGDNCGVPFVPFFHGSRRFVEMNVNESCSAIALTAHYLSRHLPSWIKVSAYNLAVSGCGYMCLVESLQGYYLTQHPKTLHIVIIDVCVNDFAVNPDELEVTYVEVAGFVRRKGGEVLFLCGWSGLLYARVTSQKTIYDVALHGDQSTLPLMMGKDSKYLYNRCSALGIRLSSRFLFPAFTYQDSLLSQDGEFSANSEAAFRNAVPALIKAPDDSHPSMFGSDFVAQTLSRWIHRRICHVLSLPPSLPSPHIPLLNSTATSLMELINAEDQFLPLIAKREGFEWRMEGVNKPGWISQSFGSILELDLPIQVTAGFLSIGYLQTYSLMGLFNLTVTHGNSFIANRRVICTISKSFSQTAFVTISFNVSTIMTPLHIVIEHLDHHKLEELDRFSDMKMFLFDLRKNHFKEAAPNSTKVKIISIGIYDSADGLASRPRDVDYNDKDHDEPDTSE